MALLGLLRRGSFTAGGCLLLIALAVCWTAFVIFVGGWFWGDVIYNGLFNHPFTDQALTQPQWLLVGVVLALFAG